MWLTWRLGDVIAGDYRFIQYVLFGTFYSVHSTQYFLLDALKSDRCFNTTFGIAKL